MKYYFEKRHKEQKNDASQAQREMLKGNQML